MGSVQIESATRQRAIPIGEIRLLVETGFAADARALVGRLRALHPEDVELVALQAWIDHRRGAISEALEGWQELSRVRPNGSAAILRLAQLRVEESTAPTRSDLPLVRRAVRLVLAGDLERALLSAQQGAAAARRGGDREQYKLLVLIEALIHELAGRPTAAVAVLTALGQEPAFAHDVDRLAILARVCEQAGDRAGLLAAERVLDFMASSGILSAYPRLLQIRRSLGDEDGLRALEERWEEAFRQRIQRSTPEERLAAATGRYVPPERLRRLLLPAPPAVEDPAERALLRLLYGDGAAAVEALAAVPGWRAEALLSLGRHEEAAAAAAEAVRLQPDLPHALLVARCPSPEPGAQAAAREILAAATEEGPAHAELLRALARLEELRGDDEAAARLRLRAEAAERRPWPPPGVVRAAAIHQSPGRQSGLVHEIIVRPIRSRKKDRGKLIDDEIHGDMGRGVRADLRRIFAAVRETLEARYPERAESFERCAWSFHFTKEDEPSGGPSLGLPAAMAIASALLDLPVPPTLVFTGAVTYDAAARIAVRPVGELGRKLEATLHYGGTALVFSAAQREEALSGQVVPPSFAREIATPVATFDEALRLVLRRSGGEPRGEGGLGSGDGSS